MRQSFTLLQGGAIERLREAGRHDLAEMALARWTLGQQVASIGDAKSAAVVDAVRLVGMANAVLRGHAGMIPSSAASNTRGVAADCSVRLGFAAFEATRRRARDALRALPAD